MRLTMQTFLTLDGVIQAPGEPGEDRSDGFEHGGWQAPLADEELGELASRWFAAADGFLLGRKTYEIFAAYWPHVTDEQLDPVAKPLNTLPKYVASTTLERVEWNNSTLLQGDVAEEVAKLKQQPGNELQVHGSADLAQTLMRHGLIDEYRLWIYPIVLGTGKRLYPEGSTPAALRLVDSTRTGSGALVQVYEPAGPVQYGTFELEQ